MPTVSGTYAAPTHALFQPLPAKVNLERLSIYTV